MEKIPSNPRARVLAGRATSVERTSAATRQLETLERGAPLLSFSCCILRQAAVRRRGSTFRTRPAERTRMRPRRSPRSIRRTPAAARRVRFWRESAASADATGTTTSSWPDLDAEIERQQRPARARAAAVPSPAARSRSRSRESGRTRRRSRRACRGRRGRSGCRRRRRRCSVRSPARSAMPAGATMRNTASESVMLCATREGAHDQHQLAQRAAEQQQADRETAGGPARSGCDARRTRRSGG